MCECEERWEEGLKQQKGTRIMCDEGWFSVSWLNPVAFIPPSHLPPKVRVTVLSSTFACVSVSDVSSTCWREKGWKTASPCHLLWNLVTCCHKPAPSRVCVCLIKWSRLSHAPPKGLAQVCPNASSPQHLSKDTSNQCYSFNHSVNGGREGLWQSVGRGQHLFTVMDFWEFTSAIAGFCNAC